MVLTYNHAAFVRRALESALRQEVDFTIEIIVGDDASRDATPDLLRQLDREYPGRLTLVLREKNVGAVANHTDLLRRCRGEFVAFLEGDDYWIEPRKLAEQVALLRREPRYAGSVHGARFVDADDRDLGFCPAESNRRTELDADSLAVENPVPTASLVFRRASCPDVPAWTAGLPMLDWPTLFSIAQHGPIHVGAGHWSAYRLHSQGMWTSAQEKRKLEAIVGFYDRIGRCFPRTAATGMPARRKESLAQLFLLTSGAGDRTAARQWLRRYFFARPNPGRLPPHQLRTVFALLTGRALSAPVHASR